MRVYDPKAAGFLKTRQCSRRVVADGLCAIHQPKAAEQRIERSLAKWAAESARRSAESKLNAAAPLLLSELCHLVRLLEPLEAEGRLNIPGLATLNGARAAIAAAGGTR